MSVADPGFGALAEERARAHERMRQLREDIEIKKACGKGVSAADQQEGASLLSRIAELDSAILAARAHEHAAEHPCSP